jgi:hypothetical protein
VKPLLTVLERNNADKKNVLELPGGYGSWRCIYVMDEDIDARYTSKENVIRDAEEKYEMNVNRLACSS